MANPVTSLPLPRHPERGGITIIIALVLIVVMSMAAFGLSRNAIRQMASSGSILQGGKSSDASDAGLDWYVVWATFDNRDYAYGTTAPSGNKSLATALYDFTHYTASNPGSVPDWYTQLANSNLLASTDASRSWDMAAAVRSDESQAASSDMVFNNIDPSVQQAGNNTGNPVIQRFDLLVRYLGTSSVSAGTSTTPVQSASGGTTGSGISDLYYQVISTGYAAVPIGNGKYLRYRQRREMVTSSPLS